MRGGPDKNDEDDAEQAASSATARTRQERKKVVVRTLTLFRSCGPRGYGSAIA